VAISLVVCTAPQVAWCVEKSWQVLIDEHAMLTRQARHEQALEVALKALTLAETSPGRDDEKLAVSLDILGTTYSDLNQK
jgi:hypothetical protein